MDCHSDTAPIQRRQTPLFAHTDVNVAYEAAKTKIDVVNPAVGLSDVLPLRAQVSKDQPLLKIHAAREDAADRAVQQVLSAITISDNAPSIPPLLHDRIGACAARFLL